MTRIRKKTIILLASLSMLGVACHLLADQSTSISNDPISIDSSDSGPRALLVGIGEYASSTGWGPLASIYDIELVEAMLAKHNFPKSNILVLKNKQATRENIVKVFEEHLIQKAKKNDVLVFHFSGHGHRITDQDHDEIDGYDEVIVPYDAPRQNKNIQKEFYSAGNYDGELHIRDDKLRELLERARFAVGEKGEVLVFIDSCFSGTISRGEGTSRGDEIPIGPPQQINSTLKLRPKLGSGIFEGVEGAPGLGSGRLVVFSASRHDQLSYETKDETGKKVGSLSLALSRVLAKSGRETTYRQVLDEIKLSMEVRNEPQGEGPLDVEIFNGRAVNQEPFFRVMQSDLETRTILLKGGSLVGLLPKMRIGFYPIGTRDPKAKVPLAQGTVQEISAFKAAVLLDESTDREIKNQLKESWAFVTAYSMIDIGVCLTLDSNLSHIATWRAGLMQEINNEPLATIAGQGKKCQANVTLRAIGDNSNKLSLETTDDGQILLAFIDPSAANFANSISRRLHDFVFNRYLRTFDFNNQAVKIRMDIIPCKMSCQIFLGQEQCECIEDLDILAKQSVGGESLWKVGDGFRLRFQNIGTRKAWFSVMDLIPDGSISMLWPRPNTSFFESSLEPSDKPFEPGISFRIGNEIGSEVLKLIATSEPVDFHVLRTKKTARGGATELERLLFDASRGVKRSEATAGFDKVSTQSIAITVVSE